MKDLLLVFLTVAGGLGTFLLGMKHLSEGLQAVSGKGLRRFMALTTTHRLAGVATGLISTVIVQSSSIITVMVVGFVSSGLLNLPQAINVIIGSNIGTTTTAWLIAYVPDVGVLGLSIIALGMVLYFFCSKEALHNLGLALMGLGFIFMGLYWMNKGVEPIKNYPGIVSVFKALDASTVCGLFKCLVISLVFTAIIQSSAATTAIAMTLATQGIISFESAAATVFGMNIGTTMTAWLAAIGSTTEARRAALAHTLFNVVGTIILMPLFIPVILPFAKSCFPNYAQAQVVAGATLYPHIAAPMAAIHTFFNVGTMLLFLPFVPQFARFVTWLVPARKKELPRLTFLNPHVKQSPIIACDQVLREVAFMADSDRDLLAAVRKILSGASNDEVEEHIFHRENVLDSVQREITEFLGHVLTARLPSDVADRARMLLRVTDEYESVSDEAPAILKMVRRLHADGQKISPASGTVILHVHDRVAAFAATVSAALAQPDPSSAAAALAHLQADSKDIHDLIRSTRQGQLGRIGPDDPGSPMRVLVELDILNAYERIRGCYVNIGEALAGGRGEKA